MCTCWYMYFGAIFLSWLLLQAVNCSFAFHPWHFLHSLLAFPHTYPGLSRWSLCTCWHSPFLAYTTALGGCWPAAHVSQKRGHNTRTLLMLSMCMGVGRSLPEPQLAPRWGCGKKGTFRYPNQPTMGNLQAHCHICYFLHLLSTPTYKLSSGPFSCQSAWISCRESQHINSPLEQVWMSAEDRPDLNLPCNIWSSQTTDRPCR